MPITIDPNLLRQTLSHPELDRAEPLTHWWMDAASSNHINSKIAEGYRLFRLKLNRIKSGEYTALFVKNEGRLQQSGAGWEQDLTQQQVQAKVNEGKIRILSICPQVTSTVPLFSIVYISNAGSQKRDYKIYFGDGGMDAILAEAKTFNGRIVDFARYSAPFKPTGSVITLMKTAYTAVITKKQNLESVTQWVGTANIEELGIITASHSLQFNEPVRFIGLDAANAERYDYVLETRPSNETNWFYEGLTTVHIDHPDDLKHVIKRLGARPIDLRKNEWTQKYAACFIDNTPMPVQGKNVSSSYNALDKVMTDALKTYGVAGATLAIMANGKLVHAKGYGYADFNGNKPATPETMMRIASVSKSITATATLRLIQDGTILKKTGKAFNLDSFVYGDIFDIVKGTEAQEQLNQLTVRHLLDHTSGINIELEWLGSEQQVRTHPEPITSVPGTKERYSNGNYHLLTMVINIVSPQKSYSAYVKEVLLDPLNIKRIAMTAAVPSNQTETKYYDNISPFNRINDWSNLADRRSGADAGAWVADPPIRQGASTWAASPIDMMRLMASIEGSRPGPKALNSKYFDLIANGTIKSGKAAYYGLGFGVNKNKVDKTFDLEHGGYLPGSTNAIWKRYASGISFCCILNGDTPLRFESKENQKIPGEQLMFWQQQTAMGQMVNGIVQFIGQLPKPWPGGLSDLFSDYGL